MNCRLHCSNPMRLASIEISMATCLTLRHSLRGHQRDRTSLRPVVRGEWLGLAVRRPCSIPKRFTVDMHARQTRPAVLQTKRVAPRLCHSRLQERGFAIPMHEPLRMNVWPTLSWNARSCRPLTNALESRLTITAVSVASPSKPFSACLAANDHADTGWEREQKS